MVEDISRRTFLQAATLGTGAVAGCLAAEKLTDDQEENWGIGGGEPEDIGGDEQKGTEDWLLVTSGEEKLLEAATMYRYAGVTLRRNASLELEAGGGKITITG